MLGTTTVLSLAPYYRQAGFTVLEPGERIAVADPLGMILHRPADRHVVQMWRALHAEVTVVDSRMSDGTPLQVLTQVLVPPAGSPEVVRHDDGSVTVSGDGVRQTMDARTAGMMEQKYRTPLTEAEVHRERRRLCATASSRSWPPGSAGVRVLAARAHGSPAWRRDFGGAAVACPTSR
ncbi:hypothetical protein ACFZA9_21250 [Streptomyces olivaceus]|uniref:hypothetical protein n=1 Tax=Streptomyces olivaceus TaxID=47716 RepID=UPI0036E03ED9